MYDRETAKKLQVTMAAGTDDQTQGLQKNSRPANFISREITLGSYFLHRELTSYIYVCLSKNDLFV